MVIICVDISYFSYSIQNYGLPQFLATALFVKQMFLVSTASLGGFLNSSSPDQVGEGHLVHGRPACMFPVILMLRPSSAGIVRTVNVQWTNSLHAMYE